MACNKFEEICNKVIASGSNQVENEREGLIAGQFCREVDARLQAAYQPIAVAYSKSDVKAAMDGEFLTGAKFCAGLDVVCHQAQAAGKAELAELKEVVRGEQLMAAKFCAGLDHGLQKIVQLPPVVKAAEATVAAHERVVESEMYKDAKKTADGEFLMAAKFCALVDKAGNSIINRIDESVVGDKYRAFQKSELGQRMSKESLVGSKFCTAVEYLFSHAPAPKGVKSLQATLESASSEKDKAKDPMIKVPKEEKAE